MNMNMREYARIGKEEELAGAIAGGSRSRRSSEDTAIWSPWFMETEDLRHTNYKHNKMAMAMTMPETKRFIYPPEEIENNPSYETLYARVGGKKRNG
jgi:hypothetical protein